VRIIWNIDIEFFYYIKVCMSLHYESWEFCNTTKFPWQEGLLLNIEEKFFIFSFEDL